MDENLSNSGNEATQFEDLEASHENKASVSSFQTVLCEPGT